MTIYRQGDILLTRADDRLFDLLEGSFREAENGRLILARGEATGHHHSVAVADAEVMDARVHDQVSGAAEAVFLRIMAPTTLDHQEHASILLEPGTYRVTRQREYAPEAPRQVAD